MGTQGSSGWITIAIYFAFFVGIFYVFIIMPRKKQEKKHNEMIETLRRGEKVVTIGGIRGEISRIKDEVITLKVSENTEIDFLKNAIAYRNEEK